MKKYPSIILLLLCTVLLHAQSRKDFQGFKIYAPDTVHHGERFTVTFALTATNYQDYIHPEIPSGFILHDFKHNTIKGDDHYTTTLECHYELEALRTGEMELPACSVTVSKKKHASQTTRIIVKPNPRYAREMDEAILFLKQKGYYTDTTNLKAVSYKPEYLLLNGGNSEFFILVASQRYMPYLDNPILAYGFDKGVSEKDNETLFELVEVYKTQLHYLKDHGEKLITNTVNSYQRKATTVAPLLGKTVWGQRAPYNKFCPKSGDKIKKEQQVVGCVPVAMAQIMRYHAWPERGEGKYAYITKGKKLFSLNFAKQTFDWSKMQDTYDTEEEDSTIITPIARLMTSSGLSVGAEFGDKSTGANSNLIKMALVNFFKYSPQCSRVISQIRMKDNQTIKLQTPDNMLGLVYRELDNKRPLIVCNDSHAFVCDGYDGEYLHFNLGWNGYCNGFYRIILVPEMDEYPLLYNEMIIGIEPDKQGDYAKTVEVKKGGTLATLLTDEEKENLRSLTIKGKLNGTDIKLLRRMAGAIDDNDYFGWRGSLQDLDISEVKMPNVTIPKNEDFYYRMNAKEVNTNIVLTKTRTKGYGFNKRHDTSYQRYDFKNLTKEEWEKICKKNLNRGDGYCITESNGTYYLNYFGNWNSIGEYQFFDCSNLKNIYLPKKIARIRKYAFMNCTSLQGVYKHAKSDKITSENGAFYHTPILSKEDLSTHVYYYENHLHMSTNEWQYHQLVQHFLKKH